MHTPGDRVDICVLGPVELRHDRGAVHLGSPKQRAVLATLAVFLNEVTSADTLVRYVWTDDVPRSARNALQVMVCRLRQVLADVAEFDLVTRPAGYVLEGPRSAVDLHRFRELVGAADDAPDPERAALLREAVDLWRGRAFADLDGNIGHRYSAEMAEERWLVLEDLFDTELRLRRHRRALAELPRVIEEQPFRERFAEQYLIALCLDGQHVAATEYFRRYRHRLRQELGIEPGPRLAHTHVEVIQGGYPAVGAVHRGAKRCVLLNAPRRWDVAG